MKLRELLIGGVATVALAGVASANDLTADAANSDPTAVPVDFAGELTGDIDGMNFSFLLDPAAGSTYLNSNQLITLTFTGATIDGASFAVANNGGANTCAGNYSVSSGGGAGDSSVVILADNLAGCDGSANDSIEFDVDLDIANGTAASVAVTVTTEGGTPVGGSGTSTLNLATWTNAFGVTITADATPPEAQLAGFTALDNSVMGTITVADTAGVQYRADGTTAVDAGTDVDDTDVTVTGDMTGLATIEGAAPVAGVATFALGAGAIAATNIDAVADGTNAIAGGSYAVAATLDLGGDAAFSTPTANNGTYTITREGTDFFFPYTLDNTTVSSLAGTVVRYRISNNSGAATGSVTLQMRSWDSAPTNTGVVTLTASIPAGADYVFTPADVEALVGAYGVGDFVVNVEASAAANALTANYAMNNANGTTNYAVLQ